VRELLQFAVAAAREAGSATLAHFHAPSRDVETKKDGSPVTAADREAESLLRARIERSCPDDGILGEEFGEKEGSSGRCWILDPIDGTKSFVRRVPLYGTLVGLEEQGRAILGVVFLPALGELVYAAKGQGAWWIRHVERSDRPLPAKVSDVGRMEDALFCSTSWNGFARAQRIDLRARLQELAAFDRGWGDCYGHILVATGRADLMVDPLLAVWDCAALLPIVEEAGGRFFDLSGRPTHRGGSGLSVNGALADRVRSLLEVRPETLAPFAERTFGNDSEA
jgi:histidinol-phosphatase